MSQDNTKFNWKQLGILLLAHHPICPTYSNDVIHIKRIKLCTGCFLALPMLFLVHNLLPLTRFYENTSFSSLIVIGTIFSSFYIILKLPFGKTKLLQYLSKLFVGLGGGFIFSSVSKLNATEATQDIILIILQMLVVWGHLLLRGFSIYKTCTKCEYSFEWDRCPGFSLD